MSIGIAYKFWPEVIARSPSINKNTALGNLSGGGRYLNHRDPAYTYNSGSGDNMCIALRGQ